jgi:Uma2 family endonuclease
MSRLPRLQKPKLGLASAGTLMTPEEFDAVTNCDERYSYELVEGVLVVAPIPLEAESDPNEELGVMLRNYRVNHPRGSVIDLTLPERYVRTLKSRRRADRVVWIGLGRIPDTVRDIPTIVVEFVSKSRRDRVRDYEHKRQQYLELGVTEYWVIDRFRRIMTVVRKDPPKTGTETTLVVQETETFRTDLLPGFDLVLADLLAVADKWQ